MLLALLRMEGAQAMNTAVMAATPARSLLCYIMTRFLDEYVTKGMKFIICADNHFIYPKILKAFRDGGIGIFGTARAKRAWPPAELREENLSGMFNHLYYSVD